VIGFTTINSVDFL